VRDLRVKPVVQPGHKCLLHPPVLAGVEREDYDAPARIQASRQVAQQHLERGELVVHRDAQRLKYPAHGEVAFVLLQSRQRGSDGAGQFRRGGETAFRERRTEFAGPRFIGVVPEKFRQCIGRSLFQHPPAG